MQVVLFHNNYDGREWIEASFFHMVQLKYLYQKSPKIVFLILAITVRVFFLLFLFASGFSLEKAENLNPDSETYIVPANSLLSDFKFLNSDKTYETNRTPGYPFVIAGAKLIASDQWKWIVIFFQYGMNILAVMVFYDLLSLLIHNQKAVNLATFLAVINLHDIYFANLILTDSLFQSIILIGIYFFVRFLLRFKTSFLVMAMACMSIAAFIRPSGYYLPFAVLIGVAVITFRNFKQLCKFSIIIFLIGIVPLLCWQHRNYRVADFNGFSSITTINLYYYHCAGINAVLNGTDFYTEQEKLMNNPELIELQKSMTLPAAEQKLAEEIILTHIPTYILLNIQGAGFIMLFPGVLDIFRIDDEKLDFLSELKEVYLQKGLKGGIFFLLTNPMGILTILNEIVLLMLAFINLIGMIRSFSYLKPWYVPTALLCFFLYFLCVSAGPNGYGSFPRFRLSISFLQSLYVGIWYAFRQEKKQKIPV